LNLKVLYKVSLTVSKVSFLDRAHHTLLALTEIALVVSHRPRGITWAADVLTSRLLYLIWVNLLN
jgi:hypothetical protein